MSEPIENDFAAQAEYGETLEGQLSECRRELTAAVKRAEKAEDVAADFKAGVSGLGRQFANQYNIIEQQEQRISELEAEVEDQKTFAYRWREEVKTLKAENAELQKKQATHEITACYFPKKGEADLTWDKLWDGSHFGITIKVTEEQGNQLAKTVPACVVMRGIVKKGGEG